jgi:hypothetical protein
MTYLSRDVRCPIPFLVFDVLQVHIRHNGAPLGILETANLHDLHILEIKRFVAASATRTFNECSWPCSSSCVEEEEEDRNLNPDKAIERLGIVNPKGMKDSVKVLDKHRKLFFLRPVKF